MSPPINTGYTYSAHPMTRVPNDGFSDSGYGTASKSSAASNDGTQRRADSEDVHVALVSSSRHKKERRLR